MKPIKIPGVYKDRNQIFTINPKGCPKVYNERIFKKNNVEYRSWNPYRSKLAAAILNDLKIDIDKDCKILYLGAATGTTVSHISDILSDGVVYAVENSAIAMKKFLSVCKNRTNIIPIFENANHPEKYNVIVPKVDFLYQDISQRNQIEIFMRNMSFYLKKNSYSIIMVKARSIDVSLKPKKVYEQTCMKLKENNYKIIDEIDLGPFEKDHAAIIVQN